MKTFTIPEFRAWAATAHWRIEDRIDAQTEIQKPIDYDEDGRAITAPYCYACAWRDAKATAPDGAEVAVTYQRGVEWPGTQRERYADTYKDYSVENVEDWLMAGIRLVDEDGDPLGRWEQYDAIRDVMSDCTTITNIDYPALIPAVVTEDIDMTPDTDKQALITIQRDGAPDIRFVGERIAATCSSADRGNSYFSGSTGRWTELELYRTRGGKYVAQQIGCTQWQGERDRYSGAVCDDVAAVIAFFGHGWLAKHLYDKAGIEDVQDVE